MDNFGITQSCLDEPDTHRSTESLHGSTWHTQDKQPPSQALAQDLTHTNSLVSSDPKGDWHPFIPRSYVWLIAGVFVLGIVVKPGARWRGYRDVRLRVVAALGIVTSSTVDFIGLTEAFFIPCEFTFPSLT